MGALTRGGGRGQGDCKVTKFSDWTPCVNLSQSRTRTVSDIGSVDGEPCPPLVEMQRCLPANVDADSEDNYAMGADAAGGSESGESSESEDKSSGASEELASTTAAATATTAAQPAATTGSEATASTRPVTYNQDQKVVVKNWEEQVGAAVRACLLLLPPVPPLLHSFHLCSSVARTELLALCSRGSSNTSPASPRRAPTKPRRRARCVRGLVALLVLRGCASPLCVV